MFVISNANALIICRIVGHLGSGQYGSVDQGIWKAPKSKPVDVALKSLTKASGEDKLKFLQEAAIMAQFRHPNVIELYGVVIRGTPVRSFNILCIFMIVSTDTDCG